MKPLTFGSSTNECLNSLGENIKNIRHFSKTIQLWGQPTILYLCHSQSNSWGGCMYFFTNADKIWEKLLIIGRSHVSLLSIWVKWRPKSVHNSPWGPRQRFLRLLTKSLLEWYWNEGMEFPSHNANIFFHRILRILEQTAHFSRLVPLARADET